MSEKIRKFPKQKERVETGPIQFGDDWPGVFIRGDNAFAYSCAVESAIDSNLSPMTESMLKNLLKLLNSSQL